MSQYDPKKLEEMQMVLLKTPRSPVFASLAEHYRKMGLLEEALEVTTRGVKHNPEYVSGLVAHAKILYELKNYAQSVEVLKKAHALKPENILALRLLGYSYLQLRQHRSALQTFKKLLILKPNDDSTLKLVKKWEFLENVPKENTSSELKLDGYDHWVQNLPNEGQVVHLIDSFINFGDKEGALEIATAALLNWRDSTDIKKRQDILLKSVTPEKREEVESDNPAFRYLKFRKEFYQSWLQRIEQRKKIDHQSAN